MVRKIVLAGLFVISPFLTRCQLLEFSPAVKLPATVNSDAEEAMPLLSPDGRKLFFTRALFDGNEGGVYAGQDIWISEYNSETWKRASNDFSINNKNNNAVIGIGKDGKTFYFVNASPFQRMNGNLCNRRN
jgi:Tol biopolymer transport system component